MFVVGNVLPLLPLVHSLTLSTPVQERRRLLLHAILAGSGLAALLVIGGPALLATLGVTVDDLRIGGGVVLMVFATHDLLFSVQQRKLRPARGDLGIVPLGVPILVGPATLTTALVLAQANKTTVVLGAIAANALVNLPLLLFSDRVLGLLGPGLSRAIGKIYSLLLAAIAASMIRIGISGL
jgi:multiple antibiotic resistance protein